MTFYSRKSARIPNFDYSSTHYYFLTICTHNRICYFGKSGQLNALGLVARQQIKEIEIHYEGVFVDQYVVMPNHVHMILILDGNHGVNNVNQIIAQYKSGVTREIHKFMPDVIVWQRSYHDHVIRNRVSYEKIWAYIEQNPIKWEEDCFYRRIEDKED